MANTSCASCTSTSVPNLSNGQPGQLFSKLCDDDYGFDGISLADAS